MSLLGKRSTAPLTLVVTLSLVLSACGFTPLYATRSTSENVVTSLAAISVQAPPDRVNRALRLSLEDQLRANTLAASKYALTLASNLGKSDVAIEQDTEVTRTNLTMRTSFILRDIESDKTMFEGTTFAIVAYNRVASEFANIIAERDAEDRVANQVAEEIRTRLAIYFERQRAS